MTGSLTIGKADLCLGLFFIAGGLLACRGSVCSVVSPVLIEHNYVGKIEQVCSNKF